MYDGQYYVWGEYYEVIERSGKDKFQKYNLFYETNAVHPKIYSNENIIGVTS